MSDPLELVVVLAIVAGVLLGAGVFLALFLREAAWKIGPETVAKLRERFGGHVRSVNGVPTLFLERDKYEAAVELSWRGGFRFHARPRGRCFGAARVGPETFGSVAAKAVGIEDILVGEPAFDDAFRVQGKPESFVRELLDLEVQAQLRVLAARGTVYLSVGPSGVHLLVRALSGGRAGRAAALESLIACGMAVAWTVPCEALPEGIEMEEVVAVREGTQCQICGVELSGVIVECTKCATPHHRDCWEFNQCCSTFACGSISWRKAAAKS